MSYHKTVEQYLEYCKFRKELDWNTLKAYRIDLKQFFEYVREDIPDKAAVEAYITELHKNISLKRSSVKSHQSGLTIAIWKKMKSFKVILLEKLK
ncbi:MAG: site-specific integrase [Sellimonas intestinalis]